ncbi:Arf guanine nucleotide exchange factor sbh1 [Tilletia horrida]|uniref:Arf guanine nucleotide exchange factor sbh1 n=1 Tax=Tilletia horrida TaxID=155126 RepID=A0AAN6GHI8_9BASI|nr:Arf guanine nucleotide exchange factor sbh1 [Tilletia horrida]KAK0565492.1 Arf guanine nucleotide exchange factor sbh1 [Tilletia horrida]
MADSKAAQLANNPQLAAAVQRNQGQLRRRAAQQTADKPNSTRAAGAGGSSNTMLRLYTDDNKGLSVDPVVVLVLAVSFVFSVVALHILAKFIRVFTKRVEREGRSGSFEDAGFQMLTSLANSDVDQ